MYSEELYYKIILPNPAFHEYLEVYDDNSAPKR